MFSVLDVLLKKYRQDQRKTAEPLAAAGQPQAPATDVLALGRPVGEQPPAVSVFAAVKKEIDEEALRGLRELYDEAAALVRWLYTTPAQECAGLKERVSALAERIAARLSGGNKDSLQICLGDYSRQDEYLIFHAVNVAFLSVELAVGLGWDKSKLIEVAVAGLLHDLGSVKIIPLLNRPERFGSGELEKVREHPLAGLELLRLAAAELPGAVFDVLRQEHERLDGSGYPRQEKAETICEYAQLIGLVDTYEALGHQRPYRMKFTPLAVINQVIAEKQRFNQKMVKTLIERFGVFPVGSIVTLNTREVGVVLRDNPGMPLRPVINIVLDAAGNQLKEPKRLDLAAAPVVYIDKCLEMLNPHL